MIDARHLHGVVEMIGEVLQGGRRELRVDLLHALHVRRAALLRFRLLFRRLRLRGRTAHPAAPAGLHANLFPQLSHGLGALRRVRFQVRPERHDLHDAAALRHGPQLLVVEVPVDVIDGLAARMGCDDRRLRDLDDVPERRRRRVRHVHHHPQTVHLGHHLLAERREAAAAGRVPIARRVANLVVPAVREGDVAGAAVVEGLHVGEVLTHRIAVLDAGHDDALAGSREPLDLVRRHREGAHLGPRPLRQRVQGVELPHGRVERRLVRRGIERLPLPDEDGQEHALHPALLHLDEIDLLPRGQHPVVAVPHVHMGVERQHLRVNRVGLHAQRVLRGRATLRPDDRRHAHRCHSRAGHQLPA